MADAPHLVIVGGGFGGLDAARALAGAPVRITLIDRQNYHLFQPLLYQVATASLSPGDIASPIRWVLRHQSNRESAARRGSRHRGRRAPNRHARQPCRNHHAVRLPDCGDGRCPRVLRASGMGVARPWAQDAGRCAGDQATGPAGVRGRRTGNRSGGRPATPHLRDCRRRSDRRGACGRARGNRAPLVTGRLPQHQSRISPNRADRGKPRPARRLSRAASPRGSSVTRAARRRGPYRFPGDGGRRGGRDDRRRAHCRADSTCGPPVWPRHRWRDCSASPSIAPGAFRPSRTSPSRATPKSSSPAIICSLQQDGAPLPGVAQVAKQQGVHAAQNVLRAIRGEPRRAFRYHDYGNMATIGRGSAVAAIGPLKMSGFVAWLIWLFIHIFWLIGFRNRLAVLTRMGVGIRHDAAARPSHHG